MNEAIRSVSLGMYQLTAKSTVSLELPLELHKTCGAEGMPEVVKLEADLLRAEALLAQMHEIRHALEQTLEILAY